MRDLRVSPRLWWSIWVVWSVVVLKGNLVMLADRLAGLPHNTVCGPFSATLSVFFTVLTAVGLTLSVRFLLHPPGKHDG